jgi:hypothetical protein
MEREVEFELRRPSDRTEITLRRGKRGVFLIEKVQLI